MTKTTAKPAAKKATPATTANKPFMATHELVLSPTVQSAAGIHAWSKFLGEADLGELIAAEREQVKKVQDGDMGLVEAMLYGQAMTLQTIFTSLARRAATNEGLKQFQVNLTLGLKAQAQSRATLEALAEIKNPRPVSFVKQANITSGPQQINNGTTTEIRTVRAGAHPPARETAGQQNKLLEHQHGNYLDAGAQSTAGGANSHLEAMAAGHRAAHP
jgi:hypothetical protein